MTNKYPYDDDEGFSVEPWEREQEKREFLRDLARDNAQALYNELKEIRLELVRQNNTLEAAERDRKGRDSIIVIGIVIWLAQDWIASGWHWIIALFTRSLGGG
jgi:hypothetical protein